MVALELLNKVQYIKHGLPLMLSRSLDYSFRIRLAKEPFAIITNSIYHQHSGRLCDPVHASIPCKLYLCNNNCCCSTGYNHSSHNYSKVLLRNKMQDRHASVRKHLLNIKLKQYLQLIRSFS